MSATPSHDSTMVSTRHAITDSPRLYLAFELGWTQWKLGFAPGPVAPRRCGDGRRSCRVGAEKEGRPPGRPSWGIQIPCIKRTPGQRDASRPPPATGEHDRPAQPQQRQRRRLGDCRQLEVSNRSVRGGSRGETGMCDVTKVATGNRRGSAKRGSVQEELRCPVGGIRVGRIQHDRKFDDPGRRDVIRAPVCTEAGKCGR